MSGNTHFAKHGDDAGAALTSEVDGLLHQAVQAANLTVKPSDDVSAVRIFNDLPATGIDGGFMVELGDFHAGETRRVLLEIDVPAIAQLGLARCASWSSDGSTSSLMKSQVASISVSVNVVPGDEAAGRTQNAEVRTELAVPTSSAHQARSVRRASGRQCGRREPRCSTRALRSPGGARPAPLRRRT